MTPAATGGSPNMMKVLLSPPVILAGVAVGAVLLIAGKGGGGAASSGPSPVTVGATVQMNQAALQAQQGLAQIQASAGAAQYQQDTQRQANLLGFLANLNNNNTVLSGQIIQSQAGITNTQITTSAAFSADVANNMERLNEAYIAANVAQMQARSQIQIAQINASEQQAAARSNAIASIFTGITKTLTTPFGGF